MSSLKKDSKPFTTKSAIRSSTQRASSSCEPSTSNAADLFEKHFGIKIRTIQKPDDIYRYDKKQQQAILAAKPWEKE